MNIDFDLDEESVDATLAKLWEKVKDGAEEGLNDTLDAGEDTARAVLLTSRRPYTTPHLHNSFDTHQFDLGDTLQGHVTNPRKHAAYIDKGVSGVERQRPDTPFSYDNKMPPLDEMIKFVKERMGGWDIDTDLDNGTIPKSRDDSGDDFELEESSAETQAKRHSEYDVIESNDSEDDNLYRIFNEETGGYTIRNTKTNNKKFVTYKELGENYNNDRFDANDLNDLIPHRETYQNLLEHFDEGKLWDSYDGAAKDGDIVEFELQRGDLAYAIVYPEEVQNGDGLTAEILAVGVRDFDYELVNNYDYKFGLEKTTTVYNPNKIWKQSDIDPDYSERIPNYKDLSEYDVEDGFKKARLNDTDDVVEGLDVKFDNGSNTFDGEISEVFEDSNVVTIQHSGDLEARVNFDENKYQIYARQEETHFRELSEGDEFIYVEDGGYNSDPEELYLRVKNKVIDQDGDIQYNTENVFESGFNQKKVYVSGYGGDFAGTRKEYPNQWASEVDLAEKVDPNERGYVKPSELTEKKFSSLDRVNTDKSNVVIEVDENKYLADLKYTGGTGGKFKVKAGFTEDGELLEYKFDYDEFAEQEFDIAAIHSKVETFYNLETDDEIIADVEDALDNDKWLDNHRGSTLVRGKVRVSGEDQAIPTKRTFVTSGAKTKRFTLDINSFVGTRKEYSGAWDAANANAGDLITFEFGDEEITGRYIPDQDVRGNKYNFGEITVYSKEKDRKYRVSDKRVIERSLETDFRNKFSNPPLTDTITTPTGFEKFDWDHINSDSIIEDKQYWAWSYREDQFVVVEKRDRGYKEFKSAEGSGFYTAEKRNPENKAFPIKIIAAENGEERSSAQVAVEKIDQELNLDLDIGVGSRPREKRQLDSATRKGIRNILADKTDVSRKAYTDLEDYIENWKSNSSPRKEEVRKIASAIAEVKNFEKETRGGHVDVSPEKVEAAETMIELSDRLIEIMDEEGDIDVNDKGVKLYRGFQQRQISAITPKIFENPEDDSHTWDGNRIHNYSFTSKKSWAKGINHTGRIKKENIIAAVDTLDSHKHRGEEEVWVDGENLTVNTAGLSIGNYSYSAIIDDNFVAGDFSQHNHGQLTTLRDNLKNVYEYDQSITSTEGAYRVRQFWDHIQNDPTITEEKISPDYAPSKPSDEVDPQPQEVIDEILKGQDPDEFDFLEDFDQSAISSTGSLGNYGFASGKSASDMEVVELPHYDPTNDSYKGLAIQTDYSPTGHGTATGVREILTYKISEALSPESVPSHKADDEVNWVAKKVSDGYMAAENIPDDINDQIYVNQFIEKAASQVIGGNWDAHSHNVYVTEDAEIQFIDLDHGAGDMDSPSPGSKTQYDDALDRTLGELWKSAKALGLNDIVNEKDFRENVLLAATSQAQRLYDSNADNFTVSGTNIIKEMESYDKKVTKGLLKNIKSNIKKFANKDY